MPYSVKKAFAIGQRAEKIVQQLFEEAGFEVVKYGYEHTVPELARRRVKIKGDTAGFVRHQPDFIVVNDKDEAFFVEVKFRKDGIIKKEHMFPYPCCYVVLLTKDFILAQDLEHIWQYGDNTFQPLNEMPPFKKIKSSLIFKHVKRVRRQLGDETLLSQKADEFITKVTKKKLYKERTAGGLLQEIVKPQTVGNKFQNFQNGCKIE